MSLAGAMNTAVSALKAQSQALAMVSDNLANSSTSGYKAVTTRFSTLVTQQFSSTSYPSGGVFSTVRQNVSAQGLVTSTTNDTDLALDGNGMFVLTDSVDGNAAYFTRNGQFTVNDEGYLTLGNYYLQGWPADSSGNISQGATNSIATLDSINVNRFSGMSSATTTETIKASLPASADVLDEHSATMEVVDSLGIAHTVTMTFTKTDTNEWSMELSNPTKASDSTSTTGTSSGGPYTITFDESGNLSSTTPSPVTLSVSGWTTGAADSTITLDLGESGSGNRLTQKTNTDSISITSISGNGITYGAYSGVEVSTDGTVYAKYDNGQQLAIYKLAVATFPNVNGLNALSDGVYQESNSSGTYALQKAGENGAGTIKSSALEASTVDTADEFTRMIVAQQAYSAASQVITSTKDMFDSLMSAVR
ncbi:flagellar hook protein FlgE [Novispirillum itersonii]|uniref:Flagellar hook protein FlgE n=1 Tax=Novispirillum itersonii TaxID=189 RepID=A0A7W9ZKX0_NOVIT|nr:flagellar hook protein FlgE [Novispirillum itersonii]MBB6212114.1 flagellar hook protein FlgE [Novispirillum itersonii]